MIGVIGWSYGLARQEPSMSNLAIARAILHVERELGELPMVAAQWEVSLGLEQLGSIVDVTVLPRLDRYLNSSDVMEEAAEPFRRAGITQVVPVAKQGLHRYVCKQYVRQAGFEVLEVKYPKVPYNRKSEQWWTLDPFAELAYAVAQKLVGYQGKLIVTDQMRDLAAQRGAP